MNAILNRNSGSVKGCKMYVGLFPCNECAKLIIQSGIREVIYMSNKNFSKPETVAARQMFDAAGISCRYWRKNYLLFLPPFSLSLPPSHLFFSSAFCSIFILLRSFNVKFMDANSFSSVSDVECLNNDQQMESFSSYLFPSHLAVLFPPFRKGFDFLFQLSLL